MTWNKPFKKIKKRLVNRKLRVTWKTSERMKIEK